MISFLIKLMFSERMFEFVKVLPIITYPGIGSKVSEFYMYYHNMVSAHLENGNIVITFKRMKYVRDCDHWTYGACCAYSAKDCACGLDLKKCNCSCDNTGVCVIRADQTVKDLIKDVCNYYADNHYEYKDDIYNLKQELKEIAKKYAM